MQINRRRLLDSQVLRLDHVVARAAASERGDVERQSANVLVLPLVGMFAKHESPRRQVIATSLHAVLIAAGSPYRISLPGGVGDESLVLRFSDADLAHALPAAAPPRGLGAPDFSTLTLLPPAAMVARSLLWRRFAHGAFDPLDVEEAGVGLLVAVLRAAFRGRRKPPRHAASRRLRAVERVKEAVALAPERKWSLAKLADLAAVSPFHLAHVFREEAGTSVYRYLLRTRLARALDAVLDSDADLGFIALDAGFASHSHFTARFRALFGLTPAELRRAATSKRARELRKIVTAPNLAPV